MYSRNTVLPTSVVTSPVDPIIHLSTLLSSTFFLWSSSLPRTWWQIISH